MEVDQSRRAAERLEGENLSARRASRGDILRTAAARLEEGGRGGGDLLFLLSYGVETGDRSALARTGEALERATRDWEDLPLRDQALLAWTCLEACRCTGRRLYGETGRKIADCFLERRRLPGGGFAEDGATVGAGENGLAIGALALAYRVQGGERYLRAAEDARIFLKTRLTTPEGQLRRFWRNRAASGQGTLEDYAFCLLGLLELYGAGFSASCLRQAASLGTEAESLLRGGGQRGEHGRGAASLALGRLARLTGRRKYHRQPRDRGDLAAEAPDRGFALLEDLEELYPPRDLVCVSAEDVPGWLPAAVGGRRLNTLVKTDGNSRGLERLAPYTASFPLPRRGQRLYLCHAGRCAPPVEDRNALERLLAEERITV